MDTPDNPNHLEYESPPMPEKTQVNPMRRSLSELASLVWQHRHRMREFMNLTGANLLYGLSALSIVYGLTQLIGPPLALSNVLGDILPCVAVLNGYELALFAVLLTIVLWRHVTRDAVCLVILVGIFWVASGMTLGIAAPSGPDICLAIGLGASTIALIKLFLLRRVLKLKMGVLSLIGIGLILLWNFLSDSLMVRPMAAYQADDLMRRTHWLYGWWIVFVGIGFCYIDATRQYYPDTKTHRPFLHSPAMVWLLTLVLAAGAGLHQYGTAYMLAVDTVSGDYLPLVALWILLLLEFVRSLGKQLGYLKISLSCVPLALTVLAVLNKSTVANGSWTPEIVFYPPVTLGFMGLIMVWMALRHKRPQLYYVAIAYGLCVLLTIGKDHTLNWPLCGAGLVTTLALIGIFKQNPHLCSAAVLILAIGMGNVDGPGRWIEQSDFTLMGASTGVVGLGILAVSLVFGRRMPRGLILIGVISLVFSVFERYPPSTQLIDLAIGLFTTIVFSALVLRTKALTIALLLWIPVVPRLYLLATQMSSWSFVVLSFPLLFLGAVVSLFMAHQKPTLQKTDRQNITGNN